MVHQQLFNQHWLNLLLALNNERQWGLDTHQLYRYLAQLQTLLPHDAPDTTFIRTAGYYHHDHMQVNALKDGDTDAWKALEIKAHEVLRKKNKLWSNDFANESRDTIQVALMALHAALPTFQYRSRFLTWCYPVILNSANRKIRDGNAQKRGCFPDSLDLHPDILAPARYQPEQQACVQDLTEKIYNLLQAQHDKRLYPIFYLSFKDDLPTEEIGARLKLHPSRVRTLLMQARILLRNDPDIQDWFNR